MIRLILFLSAFAFAVNVDAANFLLGNQGIIDIGHNQELNETVVPKQKVENEPSLTIVKNKIVSKERLYSQKFDCETDFLRTETCSQSKTVCPSNEEYTDSYSTANNVTKTYIKLCPERTILEGNKCYSDENQDGVKDFYYYIQTLSSIWKNVRLSGFDWKEEVGVVEIPPGSYLAVRHHGRGLCDDDTNRIIISVNNNLIIDSWCNEYKTPEELLINPIGSKDTGELLAYTNDTNSSVSVPFQYKSEHGSSRGWDFSYLDQYIYVKSRILERDSFLEERIDNNVYLYIETSCPDNTIEQADGSCLMEYDWYSYSCPAELSIYNTAWQVINAGGDCGNPTCTNSATPPPNNCVRPNYTCPIDSNQKCGKTLNIAGICDSGYVWNTNRCERIESYCGTSFYNSALDKCQNITEYMKLCLSGEIYNPITNDCESAVDACVNGVYNSGTNQCEELPTITCSANGYTYNRLSKKCEDISSPPCKSGYSVKDGICFGSMVVCQSGSIYNDITKKCESERCGQYGTVDSGINCGISAICDGVIIGSKCIPNTVQ